jgi:hypothetical protein
MKVDVDCINHNVALLVEKIKVDVLMGALNNNSQDDLYRVEALGEISGIIMLANNLKEVLRQ